MGIYQLKKHHDQINACIPQYDIFHFAKRRSMLFSLNLDGLTDRLLSDHYVCNSHGKIPEYFGSNSYLKSIQNFFSFYDDYKRKLPLLFIEKEPIEILDQPCYKFAKKRFIKSNFFVIIGYSFGKNSRSMDDYWTYQYFFKNLYSTNKIPILVIAPDADELAHKIRDEVKSENVYALNMRWDYLSTALLKCLAENLYPLNYKRVIRTYYNLEDASP